MLEPIRVLHCVVGMNRGGIEGLLMNIYRTIDREKIQFDFLVSLNGVYDDEIRALGGRIYLLPFIDKVGPFAYDQNLTKFLTDHSEYKIVHAHMDKFGGAIMRCAKKCGVPVRILHSHNIKSEGNIFIRSVKYRYGRLYHSATHFFACSEQAAKWMFKKKQNEAVIIKNGIILSRFTTEDNRDKSKLTIGNIARFSQQKNHSFLLDIFAELYRLDNTARLVLAGSGPLMQGMNDKAKQLNIINAVSFIGDCNNIPQLLSTLDVFCLPSLFEGLGIVLIEAQAAGVPCVASSTVPAESNVSGAVQYLPLSLTTGQWAAELLKHKGSKRTDNREKIRAAGYDITETAEFLQSFYLNCL